jgi:hypothetical protein
VAAELRADLDTTPSGDAPRLISVLTAIMLGAASLGASSHPSAAGGGAADGGNGSGGAGADGGPARKHAADSKHAESTAEAAAAVLASVIGTTHTAPAAAPHRPGRSSSAAPAPADAAATVAKPAESHDAGAGGHAWSSAANEEGLVERTLDAVLDACIRLAGVQSSGWAARLALDATGSAQARTAAARLVSLLHARAEGRLARAVAQAVADPSTGAWRAAVALGTAVELPASRLEAAKAHFEEARLKKRREE